MLEEFVDSQLDRFRSHIESGKGSFWARIRRSRVTFLVLIFCVAILQLRTLPGKMSASMFDAALIVQPPVTPRDVRLVTIADAEYTGLFGGHSPLNVQRLEGLLSAIWRGNPSLIVVDLDTSHTDFAALREPKAARILWAVDAREGDDKKIVPDLPLAGEHLQPNWTSAVAAVPNDKQGLVRSYRREFETSAGTPALSIPFAAAQAYLGRPGPIRTFSKSDNDRLLDFRYRFVIDQAPERNPLSATSVLRAAEKPGWPMGLLHNKVVLLGGTYRAARDQYATPVGMRAGAEILAQATQAEIDGTSIRPSSPFVIASIELLGGAALIFLYQQFSLRTALLASLVLIPVFSFGASLILFHRLAPLLAIIPILVAVLVSELYIKAAVFLNVSMHLKEALDSQKDGQGKSAPGD